MRSRLVPAKYVAFFLVLVASACAESSSVSEDSEDDAKPTEKTVIHTDIEGSNLASWKIVDDTHANVTIRSDTNSPAYRWYSFILRGGQHRQFTISITNAGESNASAAWVYNQPAYSADGGINWSRIAQTSYDQNVFTFTFTQSADSAWIAYQPVYNFSRWLAVADEIASHPYVASLSVIGQSRDGNPIHLVKVTDPAIPDDQKSAVWVVARQHPAEVGGSFMAEGYLRWALGDSPAADSFRTKGILYMIPFMNPDGVQRGNYRMNTAGLNLNRVWDNADPVTAPTVVAAEEAMFDYTDTGGAIRFFADFHAHSTLRKNFFYYNNTSTSNPDMLTDMEDFMRTLTGLNPDFTTNGSVLSSPGNPGIAWAWSYVTFGMHSVTFEASYQDVTYGANAGSYMTIARWRNLGAAFGEAMAISFYGAQ